MHENPKLSVVVPVYRHWTVLPDLLAALKAQTLPHTEFEVIIVANEPVPDSFDRGCLAGNMQIELCLQIGSYAARNRGIAVSRAAHVVFTDADCMPHPQWLEVMLGAVHSAPNQLWAGAVKMTRARKQTLWSCYDELRGIPQERYVARGYAACANLCVPRTALAACGGFDATRLSGGDAALCRKAATLGYAISFAPSAVVAHHAGVTAQRVTRKARRIRGGQVLCGTKIRRMAWMLRGFAPPMRETYRFWAARVPYAQRVRAILVLYLLWLVTLVETLRLMMGATPERQ